LTTDQPSHRKPLGLITATALVTGNIIGSGVFLLPSALAQYGGISLIGWLISGCGAMAIALVFAGLARQVSGSGGPYTYTRAAFGDLTGYLVAWGYWLSILAGNAAIAIALVGYLSAFFPQFDQTPPVAATAAIGFIWFLTLLNIRGLKQAGELQLVTLILKILPLFVIGIAAVLYFNPAHFEPFNLSDQSTGNAIAATVALTLWAFLGMECANIPAGEVRDARRTVPRAAIAGTLLAALIYIPSTLGVMGLIDPVTLAQSSAPFADAARILFGNWGYYLVAAGAAISCFGALNGWTLCMGQIPLAAAEDGLFPPPFGGLSRFGTPATGLIVSSILVSVLVLMNYNQSLVRQFTFVILLATMSALLPYALCALARLVIAHKSKRFSDLSVWDIGVALVAAVFSLWAIIGTGWQIMLLGGLAQLLGLPLYFWLRRRKNTEESATRN